MFHVPGCEMKVTEEWENTQSRPMWSVLFVVPASIRARFIICSLQYFWTSVVRSESYDSCSGMNRGSETTHWCNLSFIGIKRTPWCCLLSGTMLGIWYYHCTLQRKLQGAGKDGYMHLSSLHIILVPLWMEKYHFCLSGKFCGATVWNLFYIKEFQLLLRHIRQTLNQQWDLNGLVHGCLTFRLPWVTFSE